MTTDVSGLTGDLRVDLAVRGGASLRPERGGVLVDVSLTHPLSARGEPKRAACADRCSVAGDLREVQKVDKYEHLALRSGFDFEPAVFETFGAPGERTLRFLKESAKAFSRPSFPSSPSPSESTPDSLVAFLGSEDDDFGRSPSGGLLRRWFQQLVGGASKCDSVNTQAAALKMAQFVGRQSIPGGVAPRPPASSLPWFVLKRLH